MTAPIGNSFRSIVRAVGREPPPSPIIDWGSLDNNALPNLESRLKFTTHYALCVIDSEKWDHTSLTLQAKFTSARFWDHPGDATQFAISRSSVKDSSMEPAHWDAGVPWPPGLIRSIDSGEEIGRTDLCDEEVSKGMD